jgi:alpha 1,2-mannosyltransferase
MRAAHPRRHHPCASVALSKSLALRVLIGLSIVTVAVQFASLSSVIREGDSRSGAVQGFVSAWRSAFRVESSPHPPDFNPETDGELSRDYECVGWRQTTDCSPDGGRDQHQDLPCDANVTKDMAGYCEFRLKRSPETVRRVLSLHCDSLRQDVVVQCQHAPSYIAYGQRAYSYEHDAASTAAANQRELLARNGLPILTPVAFDRGIVMAVYEPGLLSAYTGVRSLRALGCLLPIELWYNPNETSAYHPLLQELLTLESVFLREIHDPRATRFYAKIHAVFYSAFDSVLLLDTDNFPVRDPAYLFATEAFATTGAVFWPDYWRPNQTIFHIHSRSLLWPMFGLPYVDMFEQESGQVLIDRRRHGAAMNVLMYYGFTLPRLHEELRILWGDKDLFRLAWMKTQSPFHYIQRPPGSAGRLNRRTRLFCGLTMVQHDPIGEVVFLHRNTMKISADPATRQTQWTHIQQFRQDASMKMYSIERSWDIFQDIPKCWGRPRNFARSHTLTPIAQFSFYELEAKLLAYAHDGLVLLDAWRLSSADHNTRPPPPPPPPPPELQASISPP